MRTQMLEHGNAVLNEVRSRTEDGQLAEVERHVRIHTNATLLIRFTWNTVEPVIPETKASFEAL
jgi:hypothetical protein